MAAENPERLNEDLWSIDRTAKFLGIKKGTLYQWISLGRGLRSYKVGNARKFDPADVHAYLREHASEPAALHQVGGGPRSAWTPPPAA